MPEQAPHIRQGPSGSCKPAASSMDLTGYGARLLLDSAYRQARPRGKYKVSRAGGRSSVNSATCPSSPTTNSWSSWRAMSSRSPGRTPASDTGECGDAARLIGPARIVDLERRPLALRGAADEQQREPDQSSDHDGQPDRPSAAMSGLHARQWIHRRLPVSIPTISVPDLPVAYHAWEGATGAPVVATVATTVAACATGAEG